MPKARALLGLLLLLSPLARAEPLPQLYPLFEMGIGVAGARFPDYPGSEHSRELYLPFPSVTYRGDLLRAKRDEGIRGRFINNRWLELDLSADGTFQSDSGDNPVREGMPDLENVLEIGPSLILHLSPPEHRDKYQLDLHLAARYAVSTDLSHIDHRGYSLNPFFELKMGSVWRPDDLIMLSLGVKYGNEKLQDYYYQVEQRYQTVQRPYFDATGGQMERSASVAIFFPLRPRLWVFAGLIAADYRDAVNRESPLLRRDQTSSILLGFYWNFYSSAIMVPDAS